MRDPKRLCGPSASLSSMSDLPVPHVPQLAQPSGSSGSALSGVLAPAEPSTFAAKQANADAAEAEAAEADAAAAGRVGAAAGGLGAEAEPNLSYLSFDLMRKIGELNKHPGSLPWTSFMFAVNRQFRDHILKTFKFVRAVVHHNGSNAKVINRLLERHMQQGQEGAGDAAAPIIRLCLLAAPELRGRQKATLPKERYHNGSPTHLSTAINLPGGWRSVGKLSLMSWNLVKWARLRAAFPDVTYLRIQHGSMEYDFLVDLGGGHSQVKRLDVIGVELGGEKERWEDEELEGEGEEEREAILRCREEDYEEVIPPSLRESNPDYFQYWRKPEDIPTAARGAGTVDRGGGWIGGGGKGWGAGPPLVLTAISNIIDLKWLVFHPKRVPKSKLRFLTPLAHLGSLANLVHFEWSSGDSYNQGLRFAARMAQLTHLGLSCASSSRPSSSALQHLLKNCKHLRSLALLSVEVNDTILTTLLDHGSRLTHFKAKSVNLLKDEHALRRCAWREVVTEHMSPETVARLPLHPLRSVIKVNARLSDSEDMSEVMEGLHAAILKISSCWEAARMEDLERGKVKEDKRHRGKLDLRVREKGWVQARLMYSILLLQELATLAPFLEELTYSADSIFYEFKAADLEALRFAHGDSLRKLTLERMAVGEEVWPVLLPSLPHLADLELKSISELPSEASFKTFCTSLCHLLTLKVDKRFHRRLCGCEKWWAHTAALSPLLTLITDPDVAAPVFTIETDVIEEGMVAEGSEEEKEEEQQQEEDKQEEFDEARLEEQEKEEGDQWNGMAHLGNEDEDEDKEMLWKNLDWSSFFQELSKCYDSD